MPKPSVSPREVPEYVRGKVVLITGAAGTVGSALVRTLAPVAQAIY